MKRLSYILLILSLALVGACRGSVDEPQKQKPSGGGGSSEEESKSGEDSGPITVQVATCNLLRPSGRRDEMSLDRPAVQEALAYSIIATGASIIAFNELDETYIPGGTYDLKAMCGGIGLSWRWKLEWPNDITDANGSVSYSYANGYAFDSSIFEQEASGYAWLAKESMQWYTDASEAYKKVGSPERTCVWARFKHKASGKRFVFFVSHLPTSSQGGAPNMALVLNRYASDRSGTLPAILAGDMNFGEGTDPYINLTKWWTDGNEGSRAGTLSGSSKSYYYTTDVFTNKHPERRIDHILTHGCTASDYRSVVFTYNYAGKDWCPSDHLPVTATITIE